MTEIENRQPVESAARPPQFESVRWCAKNNEVTELFDAAIEQFETLFKRGRPYTTAIPFKVNMIDSVRTKPGELDVLQIWPDESDKYTGLCYKVLHRMTEYLGIDEDELSAILPNAESCNLWDGKDGYDGYQGYFRSVEEVSALALAMSKALAMPRGETAEKEE